ncbi:MAG: ABC transporter permease [Myxococcales bacterium]|nr:ABC transporter permease [Myxococcales bacterium]
MRFGVRWGKRIGLSIVTTLVFVALFADILAPYDVDFRNSHTLLAPPTAQHWLGTDEDGRDLFSLLLLGAKIAVMVGFGTVLFCAVVGTLVGCISGLLGSWVDEMVMRVIDVVLAFPRILLAIFIIFLAQEPGVHTVILALSVTGWAGYARLVRAQVLVIREKGYIQAARGFGASNSRIIVAHLLPNIAAPVIVQATFGIAGAILAEASLSFLGLGPQNSVSWGRLLDQGAVLFIKSPYVGVSAGMAIVFSVMGFSLLGDALRDQLDVRSRNTP